MFFMKLLKELAYAGVAQQEVEQLIFNHHVEGSNPSTSSNYEKLAQWVEQVAVNHPVVGSSPAFLANGNKKNMWCSCC